MSEKLKLDVAKRLEAVLSLLRRVGPDDPVSGPTRHTLKTASPFPLGPGIGYPVPRTRGILLLGAEVWHWAASSWSLLMRVQADACHWGVDRL